MWVQEIVNRKQKIAGHETWNLDVSTPLNMTNPETCFKQFNQIPYQFFPKFFLRPLLLLLFSLLAMVLTNSSFSAPSS